MCLLRPHWPWRAAARTGWWCYSAADVVHTSRVRCYCVGLVQARLSHCCCRRWSLCPGTGQGGCVGYVRCRILGPGLRGAGAAALWLRGRRRRLRRFGRSCCSAETAGFSTAVVPTFNTGRRRCAVGISSRSPLLHSRLWNACSLLSACLSAILLITVF